MRHGRLREPTPRAVTRDHFGLGTGEGRFLGQHRLGDGAVQVAPPRLEERFVRRILDERMVEDDHRRRHLAMLAGEAGVAQAPQAAFNVGVIGRDGPHHRGGEFAADDAADLRELLGRPS